jgi:diphthamide biosynthesis protein 2
MFRTYRLPVVYIFGRKSIDVDHCVAQFATIFNSSSTADESKKTKAVLLRHDVAYTHLAGESAWAITHPAHIFMTRHIF